jgi:hypothetical protein
MEIHFFMSASDHKTFGFSLDPTGANLPNGFAPWEGAGSVSTDTCLTEDVRETVKRRGFCLVAFSSLIA